MTAFKADFRFKLGIRAAVWFSRDTLCVCFLFLLTSLEVCVWERVWEFSPSVFLCHPPSLIHTHTHTHSQSYFYSRLASCHITWQRGDPPVEHAGSTCKNTTTAQRKYSSSLKKKHTHTESRSGDELQPAVSERKWMNQQIHESSGSYLHPWVLQRREVDLGPTVNSLSV